MIPSLPSTSTTITSGRRKTGGGGGGSGPGGMRTQLLRQIQSSSARGQISGYSNQMQQHSSSMMKPSNFIPTSGSPRSGKGRRGGGAGSLHHSSGGGGALDDPFDDQQDGGFGDGDEEGYNQQHSAGTKNSNLMFSSENDGALSGLHLAVRYILPRITFNSSFSGTVAAMHGYTQPSRTQVTRDQTASYTCFARREPTSGVNNRSTEVICAGTSTGSVILWRYRLGGASHQGVPPPANTIPPPLVLGSHHSSVTSVAFYDDSILVTGSTDCALRLWDVNLQYISTDAPGFKAGSRCVQTVVAHESTISSVAVHGPWIVSAGSKDGTIKIWGCAPGREKLSFPFIVPLQVIVLESRITAMHCGELRAVEGVVPDLVIATADGNLTMFRSTEEALVATSTGAVQRESINVFRLAKQIRTHYPDGTIPSLLTNNNGNNNNTSQMQNANSSLNDDNELLMMGSLMKNSTTNNPSKNSTNNNTGTNSSNNAMMNNMMTGHTSSGSITSIVPLSELNTVICIGYSSSCYARDSLNFSVMNAVNHPDVSSMSNPGNAVRFVHCAYDSKKEELLLIDSLGEIFIWSTRSARIVFRTTRVVGAFYAMNAGGSGSDRGFWVAGRHDIYLIRIEREEHRLEHPTHRERVVFVSLAPSREWWSLGGSKIATSSTTSTMNEADSRNGQEEVTGGVQTTKSLQDLIGQQQLQDITPWLITASVDNTVKIWNCNMKCMHTLREKRSELSAFAILYTQPGFVMSGHEDGCVKVWAVTTHAANTLRTVHNNNTNAHAHNAIAALASSSSASVQLPPIHQNQQDNSNTNMMNSSTKNNSNTNDNGTNTTTSTNTTANSYVSASEAFSPDTPTNAFHFKAHTNTVSVVGEGTHRRNPFDPSRYEFHPHLFSTSYDGTLATWMMPTVGGSTKVKCEARVKCSDSEIVSAVYDPVQYCYWVGTNRGEVTAWSIDELRPIRRLVASSSSFSSHHNRFRHQQQNNSNSPFFTLDQSATLAGSAIYHYNPANSMNMNNNNGNNNVTNSQNLYANNNNHHQSSGGGGGNSLTTAHSEAVTSITLDANYVFTGSEDGTIKMWNGVTGELHHKNGFEYDEEGVQVLKELLLTSSSSSSANSFSAMMRRRVGGGGQFDDDFDDDSSCSSSSSSSDDHEEENDEQKYQTQTTNTSFEDFLRRHNQMIPSSSSTRQGEDGQSSINKDNDEHQGDNKPDDEHTYDHQKKKKASNSHHRRSGRNKKKLKRNRGIKMAGDVQYMHLIEETGQIVVGTRRGIVSIFDQATGKAVAIGTTNKSHNHQMLMMAAAAAGGASSNRSSSSNNNNNDHSEMQNQTMVPQPPSTEKNHATTTSARELSRRKNNMNFSSSDNHNPTSARQQQQQHKNQTQKLIEARRLMHARFLAQQTAFRQKIAREVTCLTMSTEKQELVAGLGNGSVVRVAMHAFKKVHPDNHKKDQTRNDDYYTKHHGGIDFDDMMGMPNDNDDDNHADFMSAMVPRSLDDGHGNDDDVEEERFEANF